MKFQNDKEQEIKSQLNSNSINPQLYQDFDDFNNQNQSIVIKQEYSSFTFEVNYKTEEATRLLAVFCPIRRGY